MASFSKEIVNHISVAEHEAGQRLDNYLIKILKGVPKSHIHRIIRGGEVRVNKGRAKPDYRVAAGDCVRIPPIRVAEKNVSDSLKTVPPREFEIIFEDDALLVINKPSGIAVHGGSGVSFGVIEQLRQARPEANYLELVHRLDKDTSGLLMIAKKRSALVKLHEMLRNDHPKKIYLALGVGAWQPENRHVRLPLVKYTGAAGEKMVRVGDEGQSAHTIFRVLDTFSGCLTHQETAPYKSPHTNTPPPRSPPHTTAQETESTAPSKTATSSPKPYICPAAESPASPANRASSCQTSDGDTAKP